MTQPPPSVPPAPVAPPLLRRLDSLDLLRGVAILGIFLMNTWTMSLPQDAYTNLNAYTTDWIQGNETSPGYFPDGHQLVHGADYIVYVVIHLLADMKFITMFSMLFGAGILLQEQRVAARGLKPWHIHYQRMAVLVVFGLIHAYGLWYGDILVSYAVCGMVLFPLRKLPPTLLFGLGLAMMNVVSVIDMMNIFNWHFAPLDWLQDMATVLNVSGNDFELTAYRGGWWQQMDHRAWTAFNEQTASFLLWTFWRCGGAILIGMALQRLRFFHGGWRRKSYLWMAIIAIPVGWAITYAGVVFNDAIGWSEQEGPLSVWTLGSEFNYWGSLITELGYIACGVLVAMRAAQPAHRLLNKCLGPIRAIGRSALSNYIMQTVIGTTLFYGHGFGLFGWLSRLDLLYVVFTVWTLQLVISPIYLGFFKQGPLEYLWHRLVYWRGEPPPLPDPVAVEAAQG